MSMNNELVQPRVCVIVPAYNTSAYVAETLDSVCAQTYSNYEVVVVNDGSPDTPELENALAPYRSRIQYLTRPNGGLAAARNTGIGATSAEFIALLDSDDIWEPDYLAKQIGYIRQHPETDLVYGDALFFGTELAGERFMELYPSAGDVTAEALISRRCNVMVSVLVRREALTGAGLFDERLRRCEDLDMWVRVAKSGYRIGYHNDVIIRYRRHDQSLSAGPLPMLRALTDVYGKFQENLQLSPGEQRAVEAQLAQYRAEATFFEGREAFIPGNFELARKQLAAANTVLRRPRISVITALISISPHLVHRIFTSIVRLRKRRAETALVREPNLAPLIMPNKSMEPSS